MKLLLRQCCVCKKYVNENGQHQAFLPTCPFIPISHGYCDECLGKALKEVQLAKKKIS